MFQRPFRFALQISRYVRRHQVGVRVFAVLVTIGLGFWGWMIEEPPEDAAGWLNNVFRTAQLVTLNFPDSFDTEITWQLQVARLAVPLAAAMATIHLLLGAITRPARQALGSRAKDHVIVCGRKQMSELALRSLAKGSRQVFALEKELAEGDIETLEGLGVTAIAADTSLTSSFKSLNVGEAAAVFVAGEDDLENVEFALSVISAIETRPTNRPPLILGVLITSDDLVQELTATLDASMSTRHVRLHILNPDKDGLRHALANREPVFLKSDINKPSHILIVGLTGSWRSCLNLLLIAAQDVPDALPVFTFVLDGSERQAFEAFAAERPDLGLVAKIRIIDCGQGLLPIKASRTKGTRTAPEIAVILREEPLSVATALALRRPNCALYLGQQPILVRRMVEDRIVKRISDLRDRSLTGEVVAFGGIIRAEAIDRILERKGEEEAIAHHIAYLNKNASTGEGHSLSLAAWDALPESTREANRAAVAYSRVLQHLAKHRQDMSSTNEAIDRLAPIEHRRWMAERIGKGWLSGIKRDHHRRIHPSILDYQLLSDKEKQKDRESVERLLTTSIN